MAKSRSRTRQSAGSRAEPRAQKERPAAFQDAVAEGLKLLSQSGTTAQRRVRDVFETAQETLQSRVGGAREQAQETWDNLEALFQSRVQRAMHQLGVPTAEEVRALTRRVSELNDTVSRINQRQQTTKPAKSAKPAKRAKRKAAAAPRRAPARRSKTAG
jgi:poly(hydroxyalkanoate) granule-associated protein